MWPHLSCSGRYARTCAAPTRLWDQIGARLDAAFAARVGVPIERPIGRPNEYPASTQRVPSDGARNPLGIAPTTPERSERYRRIDRPEQTRTTRRCGAVQAHQFERDEAQPTDLRGEYVGVRRVSCDRAACAQSAFVRIP